VASSSCQIPRCYFFAAFMAHYHGHLKQFSIFDHKQLCKIDNSIPSSQIHERFAISAWNSFRRKIQYNKNILTPEIVDQINNAMECHAPMKPIISRFLLDWFADNELEYWTLEDVSRWMANGSQIQLRAGRYWWHRWPNGHIEWIGNKSKKHLFFEYLAQQPGAYDMVDFDTLVIADFNLALKQIVKQWIDVQLQKYGRYVQVALNGPSTVQVIHPFNKRVYDIYVRYYDNTEYSVTIDGNRWFVWQHRIYIHWHEIATANLPIVVAQIITITHLPRIRKFVAKTKIAIWSFLCSIQRVRAWLPEHLRRMIASYLIC